jgi:hypothetical protein
MSVRIVTPADNSGSVTFDWDGNPVILDAGVLIGVDPGSDLETAIGTANLSDPTAQQQASATNGAAAGWTSNA